MIRQRHAALGALVALLSACATTSPPASVNQSAAPAAAAPAATAPADAARPAVASATNPAARTPGAPTAAPPATGTPKPFAEIVKDAKLADGLFPIWTKDDKTWIEIPAAMLDQPFFLSISLSRGIGERRLIGGLMGIAGYLAGGEFVGEFRKASGNVQLIARNTRFIAQPGSPEERAVKSGFSDSLCIGAGRQPPHDRKSS
jgi:hypothetical protein